MANATHIILVNNTCADISMFDAVLIDCVKEGKALPECIADLLTLNIITVDGKPRGIVDFA
jgi:hypothetical protein